MKSIFALLTLAFLSSGTAWAQKTVVDGSVAHLSGVLSVKKSDGTTRILSLKSGVAAGDILTTEKKSYAQINFADGSQMTLRPNSQIKIEAFKFSQAQPNADNAIFRLLKGGMRTVTGLIGKRGNRDSYRIRTVTATIGIRGSSGDTLTCPCPGVTDTSDGLAPGDYHATYTGAYIMQTSAGELTVGEGQFAFSPDNKTLPRLLPKDPGMGGKDIAFNLTFGDTLVDQKDSNMCVVK